MGEEENKINNLQLLNELIETELKMNPCIIDKDAFIDALYSNTIKFIQEHYRD
jgi:hypothetical protein